MTAPKFDPTVVDTSAIDRLSKIVTGTQNLNTAPDLVGALATGNATVQQAQAIDQYLGAMKAQQRVRLAGTTGAKINLSGVERQYLDQLGVSYGAVELTAADRNRQTIDAVTAAGFTPKLDEKGNFVAALSPEEVKAEAEAKKNQKKATMGLTGGKGFGWSSLNPITALKDAGSNVLDGMHAAWNYTDNNITNGYQPVDNLMQGGITVGGVRVELGGKGFTPSDREDARIAGYDPDSFWSMQAFMASDKTFNDTSDLEAQYGEDGVREAKQFLNNPAEFLRSAVADNDAATGAQILEEARTPEFDEMVRRVASRHGGIGNLTATNLGIDPIDNANWYKGVSAGTELAAAIALDPTNAIFVGVKAVKASQIGLNGIGDAQSVYRIFDKANPGLYARRAQYGATTFLDDTKIIREAGKDSLEAAQAFARINSRTPGFVNLIPDVIGTRRLEAGAEGLRRKNKMPEIFNAKPIETLDDFAEFLASKNGLIRIASGQAAVEGALMPGAISRYGIRSIRAAVSSKTTEMSFKITERNAHRFTPTAADNVSLLGRTADELTPAEITAMAEGSRRGTAQYEARLRSPLQRMYLAGARMTKFLPTDTTFHLGSPDSIEKVRRYGGLYLSKFDANNLAAQFARGDRGAQLSILRGLEQQTLHAAGAGHTDAGRRMIENAAYRRSERYGLTDDLRPDGTGALTPAAIHEYQMAESFHLTPYRKLREGMAKTTIWSASFGRVMEAQIVDETMAIIKAGWLLTGTNLVRNVGDAWFNVAVRGEVRGVLRAKAAAGQEGGLVARSRALDALSGMGPLPWTGRVYRALLMHGADDEALGYIARRAAKSNGVDQTAMSQAHTAGLLRQQDDVDQLTREGFGVKAHRFEYQGKIETDTRDLLGAERMVENFEKMVGSYPEFIQLVMKALRADADNATAAKADVMAYMDNSMPHIWQSSRMGNTFPDANGAWQPAVTAGEKHLAKEAQVQTILDDWTEHLAVKGGKPSEKLLAEFERTGKAPSVEWVTKNLPNDLRPLRTLKDDFIAVPPDNTVTGWVGAIADVWGRGYQRLIQQPIDRLSTSPIFYHQYGLARKGGAQYEAQLIAGGMTPEAADNILDKWAEQVAWQKTFQRTDNPELKTQLDITGRNAFAFSRATQDFIRRWGSTFIEDPGRLRRIQLSIDAATSSGLVWEDGNGQRNFTFPGTGALIDGMTQLGSKLGLPFVPEIPTSSSVTGKLIFLQSGLQNPAQFSMTPIVNIPMRNIFKLFPDQRHMLNEIDLFLNGEMGYGKDWKDQVLPGAYKKFSDATSDDQDGMLASAQKEAIAALLAGGKVPAEMDAMQLQQFLDDVRTQSRNQLVMRGVLALFAPAPPGLDSKGFDEEVDAPYALLGIRTLKEEFQKILNDTEGDKGKAMAIWAALHPDKLAYTVSGSEGTTKGAYLPATVHTQKWMDDNYSFLTDYKNVSAYFLPQGETGDFDMMAWRTQLQIGLRQQKSTEEFYKDAATITSEQRYYDMYDLYQADLADAQMKGDKEFVSQLKDEFATWKSEFYTLNPLFKEKQGDYALAVVNAEHQVETLRRVATDSDAPAEVIADQAGLRKMLDAYDEHNAFVAANPGQTKVAVANRAYERATYEKFMSDEAAKSPALSSVFNGVFRYLDKEMERVG